MDDKFDRASKTLPGEAAVDGLCADAADFDDFVREQYHGLVQFLRGRTASRQDAEDAAQESMVKLLRYRASEPQSAWQKLLYRIAINVAHDQFRSASSRHDAEHVALDEQALAAPERTPEERASHEQQLSRLRHAILALPPKCQRVYLLKRVHGMSHAEVASCCGISVKMVEKHLANALVMLRRKVGDSAQEAFE